MWNELLCVSRYKPHSENSMHLSLLLGFLATTASALHVGVGATSLSARRATTTRMDFLDDFAEGGASKARIEELINDNKWVHAATPKLCTARPPCRVRSAWLTHSRRAPVRTAPPFLAGSCCS